MRVRKQWTVHHRTTRNSGTERRKVTPVRGDRHLLRKVVNDRTASFRLLAAGLSTATCRLPQFVDVSCTVDYVQWCLYTRSSSRQTIDGCVCN
ncbi:hypothetical protein TNCV_986231 [Trichonephila clavipes]|uniref:Uncharacterized protein n=1 Tax=Trichonephila clavipes TaxID=2585209 RepID=A0A8X6SSZ0_TRICX|nr:hypothetical protein TNCV_986231 [Trichonephila clavipes]